MKKSLTFYLITLITMTFFAGCTAISDTETADTRTTSGLGQEDKDSSAQKVSEKTISKESLAQLAEPKAGDKVAIIETDFGTIKIKLFTEQVPEMTKNFEELAKTGKYNGVPFHRVMKNFMIQTGDFTEKNGRGGHSYKGPDTKLPDEIVPELKHLFGTVSMANSGPDSNGSQFFIVTNNEGTPFLDGGYTIFGQVYEGMEVADKIVDLQVPGTEKPSREINMTKVEVMTLE